MVGAWLADVGLAVASSALFAGMYTFPPTIATTMITPAAAASFHGNAVGSLARGAAGELE